MTHTRPRNWAGFLAVSVLAALSYSVVAEAKDPPLESLPMQAPDFRFVDTNGDVRALSDYRDAKGLVLFMQMNGCPIVRQSYPYLEELRAEYEPKGIAFLYIAANRWDDPETIAEEAAEYSATPPIAIDTHRALAMSLKVNRSAESFLIDPQTGEIIYRGMADDRFDYGLQRSSPEHFWLRDAIEAVLDGEIPERRKTTAKGCIYDMDVYENVDFIADVKPYLPEISTEIVANYSTPPTGAAADELADTLERAMLGTVPGIMPNELSEDAGLAFATYVQQVRGESKSSDTD